MMVTPTSAFAERGFQTDPVLAEARRPYPGKVAPRVRSAGKKRADREASASKLGVTDAVSPPGFSGLGAALPASLTAPADPAVRPRALDFSEEEIIPRYLEVWLPRQGAADG